MGVRNLENFKQIYLGKGVNAHDEDRGLYLLGRLGIPEPRTQIRWKSHVFFMPVRQVEVKK